MGACNGHLKIMEETNFYFYNGKVHAEWIVGDDKKKAAAVTRYVDQEVSGVLEIIGTKTPVEVYDIVVDVNKASFVDFLDLENKTSAKFRMIVTKLEKVNWNV